MLLLAALMLLLQSWLLWHSFRHIVVHCKELRSELTKRKPSWKSGHRCDWNNSKKKSGWMGKTLQAQLSTGCIHLYLYLCSYRYLYLYCICICIAALKTMDGWEEAGTRRQCHSPHPLFQPLVPFRICQMDCFNPSTFLFTRNCYNYQQIVLFCENEQGHSSSMIVTDQLEWGGRPQRSFWLSNPVEDEWDSVNLVRLTDLSVSPLTEMTDVFHPISDNG